MYVCLLGDMLARATILVGFRALMLQCFSAFVVLWCNSSCFVFLFFIMSFIITPPTLNYMTFLHFCFNSRSYVVLTQVLT